MKKKLLSLLLVLCMIIGMLPMVVLADGAAPTAKFKFLSSGTYASGTWITADLNPGDSRVYLTSGGYVVGDGASENNYNIKLEYPAGGVPTMYLKNAQINSEAGIYFGSIDGNYVADVCPLNIVVEEASKIIATSSSCAALDLYTSGGVTISSVNDDAKLTLSANRYGEGYGNLTVWGDLTLNNANLHMYDDTTYGTSCAQMIMAYGDITVNGGTLFLEDLQLGKDYFQEATNANTYSMLVAEGGDITIQNGANVTIYGYGNQDATKGKEQVRATGNIVFAESNIEVAVLAQSRNDYSAFNKLPDLSGYTNGYIATARVRGTTNNDWYTTYWHGVDAPEGLLIAGDVVDYDGLTADEQARVLYFKISQTAPAIVKIPVDAAGNKTAVELYKDNIKYYVVAEADGKSFLTAEGANAGNYDVALGYTDTPVIYLNGANLTNTTPIYYDDTADLKIVVEDDSTLHSVDGPAIYSRSGANVTITGDAELTVTADTGSDDLDGQRCGIITVNGGNLTLDAANVNVEFNAESPRQLSGIFVYGADLIVDGSTLNIGKGGTATTVNSPVQLVTKGDAVADAVIRNFADVTIMTVANARPFRCDGTVTITDSNFEAGSGYGGTRVIFPAGKPTEVIVNYTKNYTAVASATTPTVDTANFTMTAPADVTTFDLNSVTSYNYIKLAVRKTEAKLDIQLADGSIYSPGLNDGEAEYFVVTEPDANGNTYLTKEGATKDNYKFAFVYDGTPTIYLKGAHLKSATPIKYYRSDASVMLPLNIVVEDDSSLYSTYGPAIYIMGSTGDTTITSIGDATLTVTGSSGGPQIAGQVAGIITADGRHLTLKDANLNVEYVSTATASDLISGIYVYGADLIIDGGNLNIGKGHSFDGMNSPVQIVSGRGFIQNGANVTIMTIADARPFRCDASLTISDSNIEIGGSFGGKRVVFPAGKPTEVILDYSEDYTAIASTSTPTVDPATFTMTAPADVTTFDLANRTAYYYIKISVNKAHTHTYTNDHDSICNGCGETREVEALVDENLTFGSKTINMQSSLELSFQVNLSVLEGAVDYWVEFVKVEGKYRPNDTMTVSKEEMDSTESGGVLWPAFTRIPACDMGVNVDAVLYTVDADGIVRCSEVTSESVRAFLYRAIATYKQYPAYVKWVPVAVELLNYGAAAQDYNNFKEDAFVNKDLTDDDKSYMLDKDPVAVNNRNWGEGNDTKEVKFVSSTLNLQERIYQEILIDVANLTSAAKEDLKLVVKNQETGAVLQTVEFGAFNLYYGTQYWVPVTEIPAYEMTTIYTLEVYAGDTLLSNVATYSVESYVALTVGRDGYETSLAALRYGTAARNAVYGN